MKKKSCCEPLDPEGVTGFTDGEGCFTVSITKNDKLKVGWRVELAYEIGLNEKDLALLKQIKNYFCGVGSILYKKKIKLFILK